MNTSRNRLTAKEIGGLAERLSRIPSVQQFDKPGERQSETIAHALNDLKGSFEKVLDIIIPQLMDKNRTTDETTDTLHDLGEELRHILYHINDLDFYKYINR